MLAIIVEYLRYSSCRGGVYPCQSLLMVVFKEHYSNKELDLGRSIVDRT